MFAQEASARLRQTEACLVAPPLLPQSPHIPQPGAVTLGGGHRDHSVVRVSALRAVEDLLTMRAMPMRKRTTAKTRPPILKDS